MRLFFISLSIFFLTISEGFCQNTGILRGNVRDKNTQETIIGASVTVENTGNGSATDIDGNYKITLPVGTYRIKASFLGYVAQTKENIVISSGNAQMINFELESASSELQEVVVTFEKGKSAVAADKITPLSVQQLTTEEIKSNPGGNFDVSRVIQTLPGVGGSSSAAARNDIIIRGGAPNENVYYLDGIEIPVLNHFQTQGSSGGATGLLNVSFIEEVKLSSSAFDARYDNALASTFVIKQRDGNPEKLSGNIRLSGTEAATTLEGPLSSKTTFLASARRSYLQLLFEAIDLPIRPNFWDFQYKVTHKINPKTTLTAIGIGAIDEFTFATPKNSTPENIYITRSLPYINQWNYTTGFSLKRLVKDGFMNVSISRNMFDNSLDKFEDEKQIEEKRTFKLRSQEIENKLRLDVNKYTQGWKYSYGFMGQYVKYNASLFNQISSGISDNMGNVLVPPITINFLSALEFYKMGFFGTVSKNVLQDRLLLSFGLRTDLNSFTNTGWNPLKTLSPRFSFSYHLSPTFDLTGSMGSYYKTPTYTNLGFKNASGQWANQNMDYIQSDHYVLGTQYLPNDGLRFTLEGFYKKYSQYPISVNTGISLANQGSEFGSVGNESVKSSGVGETYGLEFYVQQKLIKNIFYVLSYTYVRSLFASADGLFRPSSWDNQHLLSGTLGINFKRNWTLGLKYRLAGGAPYTPFDLAASKQNYLLLGTGVLDFSKLNTQRLQTFQQLDIRLDKKYNFKKTTLDLYIDIQNLLLFEQESAPNYTFQRNPENTDFETTDGNPILLNGSNGIPVILENKDVSVVPTIGFIFEF